MARRGSVLVGTALYVDFGVNGLYRYAGGVLTQENTVNPEGWRGRGSPQHVDFGTEGGLQRYDGTTWQMISAMDAQGMVAVGTALYVDFGVNGLYRYAGGVLRDDTDVEGDSLSVIPVSNPVHGTLALNPDGSFTY